MITIETYADLPKRLGYHAFIVLCLLQAADMMGVYPVTAQWLFDRCPGFGINSITHALRRLTDANSQFAKKVIGGWVINKDGAFQLPLGYTITDGEAGGMLKNHCGSENHSGSDSAPLINSVIKSTDLKLKNEDLTILINTDENHSGSDFHSGSDSETVYQVSEITGKLILLSEEEVQAREKVCHENKIYARKAREIAEDVHIDVEDIRPHILWAIHEQEVNPPLDPRKKQNPTGMAIYRLLNHIPAPVIDKDGRFAECTCGDCKPKVSAWGQYFEHDTETDGEENEKP